MPARTPPRFRRSLPGFVGALGFTWSYLAILVLFPLSTLVLRASHIDWERGKALLLEPRVSSAVLLSVGCALTAAILNVLLGGMVAWVLARYEFYGRTLFDAMVDLPLALPTSVAGITLTYLYARSGPIGRILSGLGIQVAFTPVGIILAMTFVGLPLAIRSVEHVIGEMDLHLEQAALALGANPWQIFRRIQLPQLFPVLVTSFALALGRALGEYGSVLFISGNLPGRTEIAPLLIVTRLEQYDYPAAALLATVMLAAALVLNGVAQLGERWAASALKREEAA